MSHSAFHIKHYLCDSALVPPVKAQNKVTSLQDYCWVLLWPLIGPLTSDLCQSQYCSSGQGGPLLPSPTQRVKPLSGGQEVSLCNS